MYALQAYKLKYHKLMNKKDEKTHILDFLIFLFLLFIKREYNHSSNYEHKTNDVE